MTDMDAESARDMRSYSLARRRRATCKEMLSCQIQKAACSLGILGFWPLLRCKTYFPYFLSLNVMPDSKQQPDNEWPKFCHVQQNLKPGDRFWKAPETFRARKTIFSYLYLKTEKCIGLKHCTKAFSVQAKSIMNFFWKKKKNSSIMRFFYGLPGAKTFRDLRETGSWSDIISGEPF